MQRFFAFIFIGLLLTAGIANYSYAAVDIGLTIDKEGIREFHLAIGEHYKAQENEIEVCRKKNIHDNELPVVYFLARKAGVNVSAIIKMRIGGKSWMEITSQLGLTAGVFYVPLSKPAGPPYGNAYGHYRKHKKNDWSKIKFTDVEIVDFVNLRFLSEHFEYSPDEIVRLRGEGKDFISINTHIKNKKASKKDLKIADHENNSDAKAKGKSNKKGKGKECK